MSEVVIGEAELSQALQTTSRVLAQYGPSAFEQWCQACEVDFDALASLAEGWPKRIQEGIIGPVVSDAEYDPEDGSLTFELVLGDFEVSLPKMAFCVAFQLGWICSAIAVDKSNGRSRQ